VVAGAPFGSKSGERAWRSVCRLNQDPEQSIGRLPLVSRSGRGAARSFVGLAPRDSAIGAMRSRLMIVSGSASVRSPPHIAILTVIRCRPPIASLYENTTDAGRPNWIAVTTCKLRLITTPLLSIETDHNGNPPGTNGHSSSQARAPSSQRRGTCTCKH
jgi:hypothetical protein